MRISSHLVIRRNTELVAGKYSGFDSAHKAAIRPLILHSRIKPLRFRNDATRIEADSSQNQVVIYRRSSQCETIN